MEIEPKPSDKISDKNDFQIVEGELLEVSNGEEIEPFGEAETKISIKKAERMPTDNGRKKSTKTQIQYIFLPLIFLMVSLLGGLRISANGGDFIFLKPALICLVFGTILLLLFFRAKLIQLDGWLSEDFPMLENLANSGVLLTLFAASTQIFNSLIPEQGLPFWIIAFCFFWTLWNNLFADFDVKKLLKSLGALFGLAFVTKYLILANLTVTGGNWLERIIENPGQTISTYLLDLPAYSRATGYIQFFAVIFYLIGLFLLPSAPSKNRE